MKNEAVNTTVEVLGKTYQFKCAEHEAISLHQAARYLEEKMLATRESSGGLALSMDRLAVITALNITHQFLTLEQVKAADTQAADQRLRHLQQVLDEHMHGPTQLSL